MSLFSWDEGMTLGVKALDDDHKKLISLVNDLDEAIQNNKSVQILTDIFDELLKYVETHFGREEGYMKKCGYEDYEAHSEEHKKITAKLKTLRDRLAKDDDVILSVEVAEFLSSWLLDHIVVNDLSLRPAFEESGITDVQQKSDISAMEAFLDRFRVKYRIMMAAIVPLVCMVVLAGIMMVNAYRDATNMDKLVKLTHISTVFSALVHELQKERGMSAGFISSGGKKFADILPGQRKLTNEKRKLLEAALNEFDADAFGGHLPDLVEKAKKNIAKLEDNRGSVTGLNYKVPDMAKYYTGTIASLLDIVDDMVLLSTDAHITTQINVYSAILQGKERAGQERAMGAAGFSGQKFKPGIYRKFVSLLAQQQTYKSIHHKQAHADQIAFFNQTIKGPAVDEVERMRKIALDSPFTGTTGDIEGGYWFKTITEKINLMKKVEDREAADLERLAGETASKAWGVFTTLLVVMAVLLPLTVIAIMVLVKSITGPLHNISDAMVKLASGQRTITVPGIKKTDELGEMIRSYEHFRHNLIRSDLLTAQQGMDQGSAMRRAVELNSQIGTFEETISRVVLAVDQASNEMKVSADQMMATASDAQTKSSHVASAAENASQNVETVASAAEELSSSINEISRQVNQSTEVANNAVKVVEDANTNISGLAESAEKIGEVVKLINDIAEQTNLLALNATIEAARAGDAGKGFAVVASEVKNLANQTAKATEEISSQIKDIQDTTLGAVGTMKDVGESVGTFSEIATTIATAVEEQGAATSEIARSVEQASARTMEVTTNIQDVTEAASQTGAAASTVAEAAGGLTEQSQILKREVDGFLAKVREAD